MTTVTQPPNMPRRDVSWTRRLIASAAIIVVVGLLGALFATFARGRNSTRVAATATSGPLAAWSAAPHLANQPVAPMLAPSDPSVVYEAGVTGPNSQHVFRRSDDAGVTWHDLTVPSSVLGAYPLGYLAGWVDPANAQNVMVTLSRGVPMEQNDRLCPTVRATVAFAQQGNAMANMPDSGTGGCHLQFFSADGGQHWSNMQFPVPGSVSSGWGVSQRTLALLRSQGTRLYTAIHYRGESGLVRIFVSQDRGASWNLADTGLYGADRSICDFVAAPDSTTLYATTGPNECYGMITPQSITLWRSDDAGAHWSQVGQLPSAAGRIIAAFKATGKADFTLYAAAPDRARSYGVERGWASEDSGRTWKAAPTLSGQQGVNAFLNEPRDGSLIQVSQAAGQASPATPTTAGAATPTPTPFSATNPGGGNAQGSFQFTNWRPGQSDWRQIAQPITDATDVVYTVESVAQDGARTLWTVTQVGGTNFDLTYSVRMARLS